MDTLATSLARQATSRHIKGCLGPAGLSEDDTDHGLLADGLLPFSVAWFQSYVEVSISFWGPPNSWMVYNRKSHTSG